VTIVVVVVVVVIIIIIIIIIIITFVYFNRRPTAQSTQYNIRHAGRDTTATTQGSTIYKKVKPAKLLPHTAHSDWINRTGLTSWIFTRWRDQHTSDKVAHYTIYRPRKDERLSWPSWLTYSGRLTHISGHPSDAGRAWNRKSSPVFYHCATQPKSHSLGGRLPLLSQSLRLSSQLQSITTPWPIPSYTAWWQRHRGNNLSKVVTQLLPRVGFEPKTCWPQVQRSTRCATALPLATAKGYIYAPPLLLPLLFLSHWRPLPKNALNRYSPNFQNKSLRRIRVGTINPTFLFATAQERLLW